MKTCATLAALTALRAMAHAGTFAFDDPHPSFHVPVSGSTVYSINGTVILGSLEKDPWTSFGELPTLANHMDFLAPTISPSFQAYLSNATFGSDYHGPILDVPLDATTPIGNYAFSFLYPTAWIYFGFSVYDRSQPGGMIIDMPYDRYGYKVNVLPAPEPCPLAGVAACALIVLRRRRPTKI